MFSPVVFMAKHQSDKTTEPIPGEHLDRVKHKRTGAMLTSSASAHGEENQEQKRDGSSPTGVIDACLWSPSKDAHESSNSRGHSHWSKFFKLWKRSSIKRLASFPPRAMSKVTKRKSAVLRDIYNLDSSLLNFTLSELETATNNFSHDNLIGKGGYAEVYKGSLPDGKLVAVKQLIKGSSDEITTGFLSELGIIAHVDHPNTAKLIGCGVDGGMHLIFELSPHGSLGSLLHGSSREILNWSRRYKIALGIADGLTYLHETCQRRIIHRDIKADNILLTEDFEPQICDFGLAKWLPNQVTHHNVSKFEGTFGYFAPEYFMHGIVDVKTDVFAFGVLLLELLTGRRALDDSQQSLVIWSKPLLQSNDIEMLVDPVLGANYDKEEVERLVLTASLCVEQSPVLRPRMSQVVILLRGDEYVAECAKENKEKTLQRIFSEESLDVQEYNSTKYLKYMDRMKEIALDS